MKNFRKILFGFILAVVIFTACKKDENKVMYTGGTAPVFTASSTAPMVLLIANKDNPAIKFSWTNPNYQFNTGISSQTVTYILQVDTTGANFTNPKIQERSISSDLSVILTVKELNTFLTKMELTAGVAHNMEFRIKSTLGNNSVPLYSNVIKISVNNYLDFVVEPPGTATVIPVYSNGRLWIVGDAVASGWSNPLPPPYNTSQEFTRAGGPTDVLHYQATITFNATGGYKLIQEQGDWTKQYHAIDGTAKLSGDFKKENADPTFPSPGAGSYKVEFNFQTGTYKLTKL